MPAIPRATASDTARLTGGCFRAPRCSSTWETSAATTRSAAGEDTLQLTITVAPPRRGSSSLPGYIDTFGDFLEHQECISRIRAIPPILSWTTAATDSDGRTTREVT